MMMDVAMYQACCAATLGAFLCLMAAIVRGRVHGAVGAYCLVCGAAAFLAFAYALLPGYGRWFWHWGLRLEALAFFAFLAAELWRAGAGRMGLEEGVAAGALAAAFALSSLAGYRAPGSARLVLQALAVCVPVVAAAAWLWFGPQALGAPAMLTRARLPGLPLPAALRGKL